jgi:uncharacterized protein with HEPN domain
MQLESRKLLHDMWRAVSLLADFTNGKQFLDYQQDAMLRAAVEREFEIIGEAVGRLARTDPDLVGCITEHGRIIAFRNILIHGYADVDDRLVWDVVQTRLPALQSEIGMLLQPPSSPET